MLRRCLTAFVMVTVIFLSPNCSARVIGGPISEEGAAKAAQDAPNCPAFGRLPAGAKLLDFIDCTAGVSARSFADDDRSKIVTSPAGKYRQTDINDGSFFAYRFGVGQLNKLHILVVEYPDDDERTAAIMLHESKMRGKYNSDFHVEGGYSTGAEYPNTNKMLQQVIYYWPEEKSPAIICLNSHHNKSAAMSRVWVYEITEELTPPEINLPDKRYPQRQIGIFFEDSRMFRFNFGRSSNGYENCAKYLRYTGQNLLSFDSMLYSYPKCQIDALSGGGDDTSKALNVCDKYDIDFLAVFDPTSSAKIEGKPTGDLSDMAVVDGWARAMGQFVDKYGKHKSLKAVSFGGPAGANRFSSPNMAVLQKKINEKISSSDRKDITQHIFFGYRFLHRFFFNEEGFSAQDIVKSWLQRAPEGYAFKTVLAEYIEKYYEQINLKLESFTDLENTIIHRSLYVNDQRCFRFYPLRTPLWMIFRDYNQSREVSNLLSSPKTSGACLFGNYFEIVTALFKDKNFWWDRTWIASQINPSTPYFLEIYSSALANDDATVLLNSSWVNPLIGSADLVRDFAVAYRTLPAIKFDTAFVNNHVITRQLNLDGDLWFYVLNNHHTDADVLLEFPTMVPSITNLVTGEQSKQKSTMPITLKPYQLMSFRIDNYSEELLNSSAVRDGDAYMSLAERINDFGKNIRTLSTSGEFIEQGYLDTLNQAAQAFRAGRYGIADSILGYTAANALALRVQMLEREVFNVKPVAGTITLDADLDDWSDSDSVTIESSKNLVCDHWLYNNWYGEDDLSAKIWACYDDENLYIAFDVKDDVARQHDAISLYFDTDNYKDSLSQAGMAHAISLEVPSKDFSKKTSDRCYLRNANGYQGEIAISLSKLGVSSGDELGFAAILTDMDMEQEEFMSLVRRRNWRREKRMEWPVNMNYLSGRRAPSCGIMKLTTE